MGGGSPSHSTAEEDDPWDGFKGEFRPGNESPWPPCFSGLGENNANVEPSSGGELAPSVDGSALETRDPIMSTNGSRVPDIVRNVESEARRDYVDALESRDIHVFGRHGGENLAISGMQATDLAPNTAIASQRTRESLQPVRKRIFKLMNIENDNQDLSFVEKVILSRDEIFRLCNDVAAGSARATEGKKIIDFGRLNSKSMKVVGCFGSKDIMREFFRNTEVVEQGNVWTQIQNDTLAPGLYAWLRDSSVFVFYWHHGHSLPEASRKDMSCNFIRYIVDLCDTVYVCLEGRNLKDSLFESAPKFSKRHRTQRLQISLVKASEDSIKVTAGFCLESLPRVTGNELPQGTNTKSVASSSTFGHDYKLSEGLSRIALLASSTRPRKLVSFATKDKMSVKDLPAFIYKWTVENNYRLDLSKLADSDFVVFVRCAKFEEAHEYDRLMSSHKDRESEEKKKSYSVDQLVEEEQKQLARSLAPFLDSFLQYKYPSWEEKLRVSSSSECHRMAPQNSCATREVCQSQCSGEALDRTKGEWHGFSAENVAQDGLNELNRLEAEIYGLLLGKNSKQRIIFPTSAVKVCNPSSGRYIEKKPRIWTIAAAETISANASSNFAPAFYGDRVTMKCINDSSAAPRTGTVHRYTARDDQGPLLSNEDVTFSFDSSWKRVKLELLCGEGNLREWLGQQMEFPNVLRRAAWLTAVLAKLGNVGYEIDLTEDLARQTLLSENPLEVLGPFLLTPVLEFAREKWDGLRNSTTNCQCSISEGLQSLCVDMYKTFRCELESKISHIRRFTTSLLNRKIMKQCSESYESLQATLKKEEKAFLFSQKDRVSRKNSTSSLTLTIESCCLIERPGGWSRFVPWPKSNEDEKISISFIREEFEKESITWHGFELAPMKEDLDQVVLDNDYTFSPSCSTSRDIIDLNPHSQVLLRVVFLKSGQLLVFIIEGQNDPKTLLIYLCPKLGVKLTEKNCIRTIRRGFDLVAFDERSRFIALYDCSISTIKTYRFDETFLHMDWTGVDITLGEYSIGGLIWMDFVTGKSEIVFIDDLHRVRLCEVNQPGLVRSGNIHVGQAPIVKACVTPQGSCLLLLRNVKATEPVSAKFDEEPSEGFHNEITTDSLHPSTDRRDMQDASAASLSSEEQCLTIDVYKLDDSLQHFSSVPLDMKVKDSSTLVIAPVSFSSQMHIVVFDSESPSRLTSKVIKISSASEVCQLQQVSRPDEEHMEKNAGSMQSGPVLDYIFQIFEKYATSPPLSEHSRDLHLGLVLRGPSATLSGTSLSDKCMDYVQTSVNRLKRDKGKDFSALQITVSVHDAEKFQGYRPSRIDEGFPSAGPEIQMGVWMTRLICLVPIQIARAEQNALKPLVDGLQLSGDVDYADAISLANVIRFGLYEAIYDSWKGPVKVISSMGKQSSGKSYLLNHLSGSLLDVAGGRCTDGVWMTLRQGDGCLYVLLDFEGLGSFERSEQEDMLLSMLNAAISNLTVFNKKDFHLDKETEAIFERFQSGVSLVKTDAKLFRGLFYMAIKDVDVSDVEDLKKEFSSKISQICSKSQDNFLTRMYGGAVEISAMPSFNRPEYHESIADIAQTVEELQASYLSGRSFLLDLKLIIAQITTKDWSPIDSKRVALRINLLKKHLKSAISVGCFVSEGILKPLIQFDDHVDILDEPLIIHKTDFPVSDTALELSAFQEKKVTGDILFNLVANFKSIVPRKGEKDEEWHSFFEKFISALVLRRKRRVSEWIALNTSDFPNDGDIQTLQFEAVALLAEVQQNLLLCSCKCERCFLRCIQEKGHPSIHSCRGDHRCVAMCTYCLDEESTRGVGPCNDVAGHDGPHDCHEKSHTCGKCCIYAAISSNCNGDCSKKSGHSGDHQCNSRQHICNQLCSLTSCKNPCVSPIDIGDHEIHACHEKRCPCRCTMPGCNRTCATEDHFHAIDPEVTQHFCGAEHPCSVNCEYKGNCAVLTEVSKKTQTFTGRRGTFDYLLVSEQNGNRKGCCVVIPPFMDRHDGQHSHSSDPDAVHFCETRCPYCGYFCNRPMEHGGLHRTTHGNMREVNFVAESEEIDILDRKYAWGESGVAEMCQMHCKAQGRGHIHLSNCPANKANGTCRKLFDGIQHEQRKYGPDFDIPKDEMTHAAFWEYVRFEDPCSAVEQKQFALCNHQCKSDEHNPASGGVTTSAVKNISYCTESLWHQPVPKTDLTKFGTGYITDDGHHFSCDHTTNVAVNVIFIIDRSSSMGSRDIRPSMTKFSSTHDNRLGCVYEAILRFIRTRLSSVQEDIASVILFNHAADTVVSLQELKESLLDDLLRHYAAGSTTYSSGLQNAEHILSLASQDARLSRKSPVIIFLSDGGNNGGSDPLSHIGAMKALDPKLQLHTIMFGNDPSRKILEDMARAGDGTFEVSLDEVQLSRRFEGLAKSLRPKVASLL